MKLKVAANTLYQLIGKLVSSGSTFLITILIASNFGTQGFGDFEKITSFVAIFYLFADFGLNAVAVSEIKKDDQNRNQIFFHVLLLRFLISLILIFLVLALLSFLPFSGTQGFTPFVRLGIIIASLTILTQSLFTTANLLFQESLRYDQSVLASGLGSLVTLALVYLAVNNNFSLMFVILAYVIGGIAQTLISSCLIKNHLSPASLSVKINKERLFSLMKQSLPLGITLIFNVVYFRSDIILLTFMRPTAEVAYYGLAYRFFEFALVFPTFFNNALYPLLLEAKQNSLEKTREIVMASGGFLLGVSLIGSILLFILAPWLIGLTSQGFQQSIIALRILALSLPVFFLSSLLMWIIISFNEQKKLAVIYGVTMVINIVLNVLLIPKWGFIATSITTVLTEVIVLFLALLIIKNIFSKKVL